MRRGGRCVDAGGEAMLIQADWFQPDAPELAPGVEVVKARGRSEAATKGFRVLLAGG